MEISNFAGKGVTRAAMTELLDSIQYLPNLKFLKLQNNGLTDEFMDEILRIFDYKQIVAIDLSKNLLNETGNKIGFLMKTDITHVEYLDLTLNCIHREGTISLYYGM